MAKEKIDEGMARGYWNLVHDDLRLEISRKVFNWTAYMKFNELCPLGCSYCNDRITKDWDQISDLERQRIARFLATGNPESEE